MIGSEQGRTLRRQGPSPTTMAQNAVVSPRLYDRAIYLTLHPQALEDPAHRIRCNEELRLGGCTARPERALAA